MFTVTPERPADAGIIEKLLDLSFGPERHAKASYQFRQGVRPVASLTRVARDGERVVGALRYWPVKIGARGTTALLLGPLAVEPARRGEGIGRTLVALTLDLAMLAGHRLVLLVGDLDYYGRFGFEPAAARGIFMPREKPERLLLRAPLAGTLDGVAGDLRPWRSVRGRTVKPPASERPEAAERLRG